MFGVACEGSHWCMLMGSPGSEQTSIELDRSVMFIQTLLFVVPH